MVRCSLVSLIHEYGFVCVTVLDGLLRRKSLWLCAGWMGGKPGLLVSLLSQNFVLILLFFLEALSMIHEVKLCVLGVMETSYGPLCCSQTIQFFNLSSCNSFLPPGFPYEGASFGLGYGDTTLLALVQRRGNWNSEC